MARSSYREGDQPVPGYHVVDFLGRGGFGEVWKAAGPGGVEVALKILRDLGRKKVGKELRALRLLKGIRHPNLVPLTAFWLKDVHGNLIADDDSARPADPQAATSPPVAFDELIIAMGLAERNLFDRLDECQQANLTGIPVRELLTYMEDAARAIDVLNTQHNIQHCDIKPQNILILSGAAQVCDFGLAKAIGDIRESSMAAGTIAYGAPEVLMGQGPSPSTDQYSLAISYCELRTGRLPFGADSITEVLSAKQFGRLELSLLTPREQEVISVATAVDPAERFSSTGKLVRELRRSFPEEDSVLAAAKLRSSSVILSRRRDEIVPGYVKIRLLHRGKWDEVWEAWAPGKKRVALVVENLKTLPLPLDVDALATVHNLRHDHLSEPHAFWLLDESGDVLPDDLRDSPEAPAPARLVIAGKFVGRTLKDRLDDCRREYEAIPLPELLYYVQQIAAAVDFLNTPQHLVGGRAFGIQQCNLRPENFLLDGDRVRIGNHARARLLEGRSAPFPHHGENWQQRWMAPEILAGTLDRRSDQFALAMSYVEMRTGNDTKSGGVDLSGLPSAEAAVLRQALAPNPADRFDSCTALVQALIQSCGVAPQPPQASSATPPATWTYATVPVAESKTKTAPFQTAAASLAITETFVARHAEKKAPPIPADTKASPIQDTPAGEDESHVSEQQITATLQPRTWRKWHWAILVVPLAILLIAIAAIAAAVFRL